MGLVDMKLRRIVSRGWRTAAIVSIGAVLGSCSVTRRIPERSYLLRRNVVVTDKDAPRRERIYAGDLEKHIQQRTNRHFLGTNFYAWLYAQADPAKDNGWNRFLRRAGQEPVVWSPEGSLRSKEYLTNYIVARGFFDAEVTCRIDTLRGRKVKASYTVRQGPPWRIGAVRTSFDDASLREEVMADSTATLLRTGGMFDVGVMDAERERITTALRNRGYWDFDKTSITFIADSMAGQRTIDLEMVVGGLPAGRGEGGVPLHVPHRRYRMGRVSVRPGYDPLGGQPTPPDTLRYSGLDIIGDGTTKVRPRVLRRAIKLRTGEYYSASTAAETSVEMMRLGAFRSVSMLFDRAAGAAALNTGLSRADTLTASAKVDSTGAVSPTLPAEGVLDCEIRGVAGLRQTLGIDLEGSTTSSFYALRTTLGYQNRNLFRGAELLDVSFTAGFEFLKAGLRKLSYELGGSVSLSFPRLVFWWMERRPSVKRPLSTLSLSANWQDRVYYSRALFGLNWGYTWGVRRFENFTLKPIDISVVDMKKLSSGFLEELENPYLAASYDDQLIAGLSASWVYNNQARNLRAGAVVVRITAETTGNLLSGIARLAKTRDPSGDHYNLFGIRFSQYARADVSFSHKVVLGEKTQFAYRLYAGAIYSYGNSSSPPFDKQFFAGGAGSMRGWAVRTLGPGTRPYVKQRYPAQMGDVKFEANAELRFPMFRLVGGALFLDAGNIWFMHSRPELYPDEAVFHIGNFYRQLGFNTGLGVRVDLRFVVLRLDWGIQLHSPNRPVGERWIHNFRWSGTALNFGVGYPF